MKENKSQYEAIRLVKGPARILAGPGAGKTYVLVNRILHLIKECKVPPDKILVITFTKAAAAEMQERFLKTNGAFLPVHFHTFHSLFYYFLKQSHIYSGFSVLTNQDKFPIINRINQRVKQKFPTEPYVSSEYLASAIAFSLNRGLKDITDDLLSPDCRQFIMDEYMSELNGCKKLDFDDFANKALEVFDTYKGLLERFRSAYEYILIDEFQDINPVQYKVIKEVAKPLNNIFVVGDDDQSIYGFRGSEPSIMRQFAEDYPLAKCVLLDVNYRCSEEVLQYALKCIDDNQNRIHKDLCAERGQIEPVKIVAAPDKTAMGREIVGAIKNHSGKLSEIAIICRTNAGLDEYAMLLKRHGIGYYYRERKKKGIFDTNAVKDIMAYYRIASDLASRKDYLRILDKGALSVPRSLFKDEKTGLNELIRLSDGDFLLRENLASFERKMTTLRRLDPLSGINYVMKALGYERELLSLSIRKPEDYESSLNALESFNDLASGQTDIKAFVRFCEEYDAFEKERFEQSGNEEVMDSDDKVRLLTMHGAKGLEFPVVILPDLNEGKLPHRRSGDEEAIEEERRLFYVAMTRAMNRLYLMYIGGPDDHRNHPSRFLKL